MDEEGDKIVYLEDKIDELFKMYLDSFNKKSKALLNTLAKNEKKINYKNYSYKILLLNDKFHEFNFFEKYGDLYSSLDDLVTEKKTVKSANNAQRSFILDLMHGYNYWDFNEKTQLDFKEGRSHSPALAIVNDVFLNTKKIK